jgi:hypothetical protein
VDLSVGDIQALIETVGEHLTFDDETSGDVRGPPTSLRSLFTLAVAFDSISPLLRYYRAAREMGLIETKTLGGLRPPHFTLPTRKP